MTGAPKDPHVGMTVLNTQEVPATFSNKFHITVAENHVRIVFGHMFLREEMLKAHTSVVMGVGDAHELARLILKLIEQNIAEQKQSMAEQGKPGDTDAG